MTWKRLSLAAGLWLALASLGAAAEGERWIFYENFDSSSFTLPANWVVQNDNKDTQTWQMQLFGGARGGPAVRYLSHSINMADDWLFSPLLALAPQTSYTLHFKRRVTASTRPHQMRVWLAASQTAASAATEILALPDITDAAMKQSSATFQVAAAGSFSVGFHERSDPNRLALYLDDVILARPATDLRAYLQLDKVFYDHSNTYASTESIRSLVYVKNVSNGPVKANGLLSLGHEGDPQVVLSFRVTGPDGQPVPFEMRYRLTLPDVDDFEVLAPGKAVRKYYDLSRGAFDFSAPGTYTVQAVYRNIHQLPDGSAWLGQLVSDPVELEIK